ncbi:probable inactive 2-oxoglutarate-dependent dioxygenase AOP2 [Cynara cardunculus var. scolymus]|uniref:probable inactive 2-oxoglutarate-dependent dioxygenase AOP2 n=1 Tax=Cynara cardunculus var. scolymus TaxID=59895 RepID=UPI000D630795|nr:probable inactive 2-oxoglutarate-dependent dioxygenase AOP2 [Cynara cardunculus var. scolymus]
MVSVSQPRLPVINMDDLQVGSEGWMVTCEKVTRALEEYGCFMAIYERVSKELNKEVFDSLETLFELPTETKIKNTSDTPFYGYLGPNHTRPLFESLGIENATSFDHVQHFANRMWPSGNRDFSENINSYANLVSELEAMVKRMVFQSYGVEKYYESYNRSSMTYLLRVNKYKPAKTGESNVATTAIHTDKSFFTILSQNHVNGLEVQTKDDKWVTVEFLPSSFVVMASDIFMAWSNGRLRSTRHRVMMNGQEDRYSIALFTFKKGITEIPEELVDEEHPLRFKPFNHLEFIGHHSKSPLYVDERAIKVFCGV